VTATARAIEDPEEFATAVEGFVAADPARSTVLATVLADVLAGVRSYPGSSWLVAEDAGDVVGVAMQTPPHRLWLSAMPDDAASAIARVMAERTPPQTLAGIAGRREAAAAAARQWQALRPAETIAEVRALRSYALDRLLSPRDVPGSARLAVESDVPLLHAWLAAFAVESDIDVLDVEASTAARLAGHGAFLLWEDGGSVVAIAGHSAQVAGMARVGPVYTPPEQRTRGYGTALTAATTQHALDAGATEVVLFTDLANPTSNSIYQQIGYRPTGDFVELDLV
jgi:predicted GNAT family acetyltransferase